MRFSRTSVGTRLYFSVLSVFLVFAVAFIIFQQAREKQYKIDTLNIRLQDYNTRMNDALCHNGDSNALDINHYVDDHAMLGLRVTVIKPDGRVVYDNTVSDLQTLGNHSNRPEVQQALQNGTGSIVERSSVTSKRDFFYSATYFKGDGRIIRSALPYDNNLSKSLKADQHYIWFAVSAIVLLTLILYRYIRRLGDNITKLRTFATRADHGESLETEDLAEFPDDELGEIAERIVKLYRRWQTTRHEQDRLKRQLTQNIAHELKTPVASIQGYLETILSNPHISEQTREQFLTRSFAQTQRLTSLLHDISTLNRMDDAPMPTSFEEVNITTTVEGIIRETALQISQHRMTFNNHVPQGVTVEGNSSLLYSVFRNLTDNAIAYAGEGSTITLTAEDKGESWHFMFADNGVGVPEEHLARLFERFYRVDKGRSRKMGGTGLGLAIVKNAVLLHGGSISVSNRTGGGLIFDFTIQKHNKK